MRNGSNTRFALAAIQAVPVYFDREKAVDKACHLIEEAASKGATLAAFGETWLGGYPFWVNSAQSGKWWSACAEYLANAIEIPSPATDRLCESARRGGIDVVIGVVELDPQTHGTVYCTLLFISSEGNILGSHRKLKPTSNERAIWGEGNALGLRAYERPYGRISGLNCWEHNMVLPGYALMVQGLHVHVAAWPGREPLSAPSDSPMYARQLLLSRAFASQAACYVICVAGIRLKEHTPERYLELSQWDQTGDSYIIDPRGEIIAGPAIGETILTVQGSLEDILRAKAAFDLGGHYSRPDIFQLLINEDVPNRVIYGGSKVASIGTSELSVSPTIEVVGENEERSNIPKWKNTDTIINKQKK